MKQKLLITASTFPRWESDTEPRFVYDLAKSIEEEFEITILVPAAIGAKSEEMFGKIRILRYHYFPIHKWETLCYPGAIVPRIKEKKIRILLVPFLLMSLFYQLLMLTNKFDVVHAHWLIPQGIVQSFFKTPYLMTGHGGDVTSFNRGIIKYFKKVAIKNACAVTAVSSHLKGVLQQLSLSKEIFVLPMGCDTSLFGPEHRESNLFLQGDKKVILFVGRLAEKKGVTYLIDAMKNIDAKLVIVGTGPLEESLKLQASSIKEKISFLGPKTHAELAEIYASADVFVAPSIKAKDGDIEGFGLVFLEAMASGLPVVASNSGGIPDLVINEFNGLLISPSNSEDIVEKINRIFKDHILCKKLTDNAMITASKYDYQNIGAQYAEIIRRCANKSC